MQFLHGRRPTGRAAANGRMRERFPRLGTFAALAPAMAKKPGTRNVDVEIRRQFPAAAGDFRQGFATHHATSAPKALPFDWRQRTGGLGGVNFGAPENLI